MRGVSLDGPYVMRGKLYGVSEGILEVGSENWYAWLWADGPRAFVFSSAAGEWHRARREWRRECAYWYVTCRVGGRLRRFYLGALRGLDVARLEEVARAIAVAREEAKAC